MTFGEYVSSFITFEVLVKLLKTIYENQFLLNIGKDSEKEINDLFIYTEEAIFDLKKG